MFAVASSACFHQVVQTGASPSSTVIDKPFVSTWLFGLVPASEVDVKGQCPTGIATVESEQSFLNGFVSVLTIGIYTPQHVRITCATRTASRPSGAAEIRLPGDANAEQERDAFTRAANLAIETRAQVFVRFSDR
jgi:hypothetical protein